MREEKTEPRSAFLVRQDEIMAQRAQAERDREARQIITAVDETPKQILPDDRKPAIITRQDLESGEVTSRTIQPTPENTQRFIRPAPLALDEIKDQLIEAGNSIDPAQGRYDSDTANLDEFFKEQTALKLELAALQQQVREKQARLTELEAQGTPKDRLLSSIIGLERDVAGLGGNLLETLSENAAQRIYGISYSELSVDSKRDVAAKYRKHLHRYVTGSYTRLGKQAATATAEQAQRRVVELLDDVHNLITTQFDK